MDCLYSTPAHLSGMPYHRLRVGDFAIRSLPATILDSSYVIVRVMPLTGDELQYLVRGCRDATERVIFESQIEQLEISVKPRIT